MTQQQCFSLRALMWPEYLSGYSDGRLSVADCLPVRGREETVGGEELQEGEARSKGGVREREKGRVFFTIEQSKEGNEGVTMRISFPTSFPPW